VIAQSPNTTTARHVVLETPRLRLLRFELADAPFIVELVNEPGWLRFIGDKGVRNVEDAERYLRTGPLDHYARLGFGLYLIERKVDGMPLGMCGLIKRDTLECVDIGFALLARVAGQGIAHEAAAAVLDHARHVGLTRLMAITTPDNDQSQKLLRKLGMRFDQEIRSHGCEGAPDGQDARMVRSHGCEGAPNDAVLHLFVTELG